MRNEFLCISVLRVASGPRVNLAGRKSTLTAPTRPQPPPVYSTVLRRWFLFFRPFSIAITSLGEEIANLSAFRTFVRFALVWFCLFPLPLRVWEGLRLKSSLRFSWFYVFFVSKGNPFLLLLWLWRSLDFSPTSFVLYPWELPVWRAMTSRLFFR